MHDSPEPRHSDGTETSRSDHSGETIDPAPTPRPETGTGRSPLRGRDAGIVRAGAETLLASTTAAVSMLALSALGLLIVSDVRLAGPDVLVTLAALAASAALGGHLHGSVTGAGDPDGFGSTAPGTDHIGSLSVGLLPLGVSALGLGLLAALTVRAYRRHGLHLVRAQLPRAVGGVATFAAAAAGIALLSRYTYAAEGSAFRLAISLRRTVVGATLLAAGTLAATLLVLHRGELAATRRLAGVLADPLRGVAAVLGVIAAATAVIGLVVAAYSGPSAGFTAATVVLGLPNLVGYLLLLAVGTPVAGGGSHIGLVALVDPPTTAAVRDQGAVTLASLARDQSLWWVVPVVVGMLVIGGALLSAVRAGTRDHDRVRALAVYAALWPLLLGVAAVVLRVGAAVTVNGEPTQNGTLTTTLAPAVGRAVVGALVAGAAAAVVGGLLARRWPGGRPPDMSKG